MSRRKEIAAELRSWADTMDGHSLLSEAADLIDPPDDDSTVDVRIFVRVDVIAGFAFVAAAAYPGATDDDLRERVDLDAENNWSDAPALCWITARAPKPGPEVDGTVDS